MCIMIEGPELTLVDFINIFDNLRRKNLHILLQTLFIINYYIIIIRIIWLELWLRGNPRAPLYIKPCLPYNMAFKINCFDSFFEKY